MTPGLHSLWNSPGQNTGVGSLSLPQGILPTQGSNPGLLHCRQMIYQLSNKRSPRKLEWVAYSFSSRSSQPPELNQVLLHCRQILYQWSYEKSPIVLNSNPNIPWHSHYISQMDLSLRFLLIFSIWWDSLPIFSCSSLDIVFFGSLSMVKIIT